VRLVSAAVQLNVVIDDEITLRPLQVQPISIAAGDWPLFDLDAHLGELQRQVDEQPAG
jgi:hypothetical protein